MLNLFYLYSNSFAFPFILFYFICRAIVLFSCCVCFCFTSKIRFRFLQSGGQRKGKAVIEDVYSIVIARSNLETKEGQSCFCKRVLIFIVRAVAKLKNWVCQCTKLGVSGSDVSNCAVQTSFCNVFRLEFCKVVIVCRQVRSFAKFARWGSGNFVAQQIRDVWNCAQSCGATFACLKVR